VRISGWWIPSQQPRSRNGRRTVVVCHGMASNKADQLMLARDLVPAGFNVLAMPGNHDWYDGLNGFMYHTCGTEPLAEVNYDEAGLTRRQRLAKYSWRSPAPPERERVTTLRADSARLSPRRPGPSREALEMTRGVVSYAHLSWSSNATTLRASRAHRSAVPSATSATCR